MYLEVHCKYADMKRKRWKLCGKTYSVQYILSRTI